MLGAKKFSLLNLASVSSRPSHQTRIRAFVRLLCTKMNLATQADPLFIKIKFTWPCGAPQRRSNFPGQFQLWRSQINWKGNSPMRKLALIAATAGSLALSAVAAPAEARGGFGPGLAGGLIAGAVIGGIASNAYAYGPYGYYGGYGPRYYGGYAPVYYGGGYVPYYGYGYRRVYRPAYAYYGGPRYYGGWHRGWSYGW